MDNNKIVLSLLVLILLGSFIAMSWFSGKLDRQMLTINNLENKIAALDTFNKSLATTCSAANHVPDREPASIPKATPKKMLRGDIYKIVFSHNKELNACYSMRENKKSDQRRMIVSVVIKNNGDVLEARTLNSDINNKKVEDCVSSLIQHIRFPEFDGDTYRDEIYISFDSRSLV
jgi:hypothetical protein